MTDYPEYSGTNQSDLLRPTYLDKLLGTEGANQAGFEGAHAGSQSRVWTLAEKWLQDFLGWIKDDGRSQPQIDYNSGFLNGTLLSNDAKAAFILGTGKHNNHVAEVDLLFVNRDFNPLEPASLTNRPGFYNVLEVVKNNEVAAALASENLSPGTPEYDARKVQIEASLKSKFAGYTAAWHQVVNYAQIHAGVPGRDASIPELAVTNQDARVLAGKLSSPMAAFEALLSGSIQEVFDRVRNLTIFQEGVSNYNSGSYVDPDLRPEWGRQYFGNIFDADPSGADQAWHKATAADILTRSAIVSAIGDADTGFVEHFRVYDTANAGNGGPVGVARGVIQDTIGKAYGDKLPVDAQLPLGDFLDILRGAGTESNPAYRPTNLAKPSELKAAAEAVVDIVKQVDGGKIGDVTLGRQAKAYALTADLMSKLYGDNLTAWDNPVAFDNLAKTFERSLELASGSRARLDAANVDAELRSGSADKFKALLEKATNVDDFIENLKTEAKDFESFKSVVSSLYDEVRNLDPENLDPVFVKKLASHVAATQSLSPSKLQANGDLVKFEPEHGPIDGPKSPDDANLKNKLTGPEYESVRQTWLRGIDEAFGTNLSELFSTDSVARLFSTIVERSSLAAEMLGQQLYGFLDRYAPATAQHLASRLAELSPEGAKLLEDVIKPFYDGVRNTAPDATGAPLETPEAKDVSVPKSSFDAFKFGTGILLAPAVKLLLAAGTYDSEQFEKLWQEEENALYIAAAGIVGLGMATRALANYPNGRWALVSGIALFELADWIQIAAIGKDLVAEQWQTSLLAPASVPSLRLMGRNGLM